MNINVYIFNVCMCKIGIYIYDLHEHCLNSDW